MEEMRYNQNYDLYVTKDGNVYWKDYYGNFNIKQQHKTEKGYMYVRKMANGARKKIKVHRLVAEAFIPNPENKPQVDHINRIRDDNRVENLRWTTAKENSENRKPIIKHKRHEFKESQNKNKIINDM